ncbi:VOC family protein [Kitasatospora sp. NBC_01250]|uniref:VOC family protein n=1 Tax=unclassified Kitasatospora TaxID=2633591 RepID=UPI002E10D6BB|nr:MULTISPECIES: VOC family protein [unclassified Kitasatospora]WSJ68436.1 VOC family protein [Kitasatospora sp. NBC_01302]
MSSLVRSITFDCADPAAVAAFWQQVTGRPVVNDGTESEPEYLLAPLDGTDAGNLLFLPVPEGKTVKNRIHLDLQPTDRSRDEEVARLLALGATLLDDRRNPDGTGWAVLADPEGNELCVLRSAAERAATGH